MASIVKLPDVFLVKDVAATFPFGLGKVDITFFFIGYRLVLHAIPPMPATQSHRNLPGKKGVRHLWPWCEYAEKAMAFLC